MILYSAATKVECFQYSLHLCDGTLAEKIGSNFVVRRSAKSQPLIVGLMMNMQILKASADALHRMLASYNKAGRKNTTKTNKIRTLMKLNIVEDNVPAAILEKIEAACVSMDEKRKKGNQKQQNDEMQDEMEEEEEASMHLKHNLMKSSTRSIN